MLKWNCSIQGLKQKHCLCILIIYFLWVLKLMGLGEKRWRRGTKVGGLTWTSAQRLKMTLSAFCVPFSLLVHFLTVLNCIFSKCHPTRCRLMEKLPTQPERPLTVTARYYTTATSADMQQWGADLHLNIDSLIIVSISSPKISYVQNQCPAVKEVLCSSLDFWGNINQNMYTKNWGSL